MKAVIQRVEKANVEINNEITAKIDKGLVILLGIAEHDSSEICKKLAEKCAALRIFEDEEGRLNKSALDFGYDILIVSNFTLIADTKKGKRPSFIKAAKAPLSVDLYEGFVEYIKLAGIKKVKTGTFGADMKISLVNDGPVTIAIDTDDWLN